MSATLYTYQPADPPSHLHSTGLFPHPPLFKGCSRLLKVDVLRLHSIEWFELIGWKP